MWFAMNEAPNNGVLWPIMLTSKSLIGAQTCYSNIETEVLGILLGLENFDHYCFAHEVNMITDHKQLVAIFKKDVTSLSHGL